KEITNELITQLPNCDHFAQRFHPSFSNWLPFYWHSYEQVTRYTYLLDDLSNLDSVFDNFRDNIKRNIRKAEKIVTISEGDDIDAFYKVNKMTYERQKIKIPRSINYVKKIDTECKERNCRKILFAKDNDGNIHAVLYIIWDSNCCYYLMGGSDPKFKNSDATSLLFWEAIKFSSSQNLSFDFEGSMIEPIERYIRGFGAIQTPFFQITKTSSRLLLLRRFLLKFINPEKLVQ
ncbi:MAG: GNAT family N-acetyltransferase, partial [Bacteroidia bacterium]|nr:GNAT family N-acetyltransferase [Bacteroidia bacterium]